MYEARQNKEKVSRAIISSTKDTKRHISKRVYQRIDIGKGLAIGGTVGLLLLRILNKARCWSLNLSQERINDVPTVRSDFGRKLRAGGLYTSELNNQEIMEQIRKLTAINHAFLYDIMKNDQNEDIKYLVEMVNNIHNNPNEVPGELCHDLTRYLIEKGKVPKERPRIDDLRMNGEKKEYNLNGEKKLEELLSDAPVGTTIFLGSEDALGGHSFTIIGKHNNHIVVADRQPANGKASLKYVNAMENELKLSRNLNPNNVQDIDREFSGSIVLRLVQSYNDEKNDTH